MSIEKFGAFYLYITNFIFTAFAVIKQSVFFLCKQNELKEQ